MRTVNLRIVFMLKICFGLLALLMLMGCVSEQFRYLETQQEMNLTTQYLLQKEKTIHDLEAFIALNQKAIESIQNGEPMLMNGKEVSLIEARHNIQNAQALLPAMQLERQQLIEKRKSLNMIIREQSTSNSGFI